MSKKPKPARHVIERERETERKGMRKKRRGREEVEVRNTVRMSENCKKLNKTKRSEAA